MQGANMVKRPHARRLAAAVVVAVGAAFLTLTAPSDADVTAVQGSAFGYSGNVTLFGGAQTPVGPTPMVTMPPGGTQTAATGAVRFGPATLFTSGPITVSSQGTTGPAGSVTSSATIETINTSGQEVFTATSLASTCTA